jgi:hypothetical protein
MIFGYLWIIYVCISRINDPGAHIWWVHGFAYKIGYDITREGANKLSPGWEGPFRVTEVCQPGCVCLAMNYEEPLLNPWNIEHLHQFDP